MLENRLQWGVLLFFSSQHCIADMCLLSTSKMHYLCRPSQPIRNKSHLCLIFFGSHICCQAEWVCQCFGNVCATASSLPTYLLFGHSMREAIKGRMRLFPGSPAGRKTWKTGCVCAIHHHLPPSHPTYTHTHPPHTGLCVTKLSSATERKHFHGNESSKVRHMKWKPGVDWFIDNYTFFKMMCKQIFFIFNFFLISISI